VDFPDMVEGFSDEDEGADAQYHGDQFEAGDGQRLSQRSQLGLGEQEGGFWLAIDS
jgi:hypothetical protein